MDSLLTSLPARVRALSPERQELVHRLLQERGLTGPDLPVLPRPAGRDRVPASLAQERLWLQKRLEPDNAAYTIPLAVRFDGPLDTAALESALHRIAVRHEALRTSFEEAGGHLFQVVHPPAAFRLPVETVAGEAEARERAAGEIRRPFDLAGPLWRALLLRLDERAHVLVLTLDHIVADEWSVGLLIRETAELYRSQLQGEAPDLPRLPVQYPDFSEWQRQWLTPDLIDAQLASWRRRLEPLPPLPWPGAGEGRRGSTHTFQLGEDLTRGLNRLARAGNATLFMLLMAAYQSLIAWHAGQEELTVGTDLAGRERPEIEPLIGFFVNQSVLRADLRGDPPFLAHLGRTREAVLGALACQSLPFQHLADALRPRRGGAGAPLFRTKLVLQERRDGPAALDGLALSPFEAETGSYKFELLLNLREEGSISPTLRGTFEANAELFDTPTLAFLAGQLESLLRWIVADPAIRHGDLVRRLDEAGAGRREEELKSLQSRQAGKLRTARRRGLDAS